MIASRDRYWRHRSHYPQSATTVGTVCFIRRGVYKIYKISFVAFATCGIEYELFGDFVKRRGHRGFLLSSCRRSCDFRTGSEENTVEECQLCSLLSGNARAKPLIAIWYVKVISFILGLIEGPRAGSMNVPNEWATNGQWQRQRGW